MLQKHRKMTEAEQAKRDIEELDARVRLMTPKGREFYLTKLQALTMTGGQSRLFDELYQHDYLCKPVDVETFVHGAEYLGNTFRESIYPKIVDDLVELFAGTYSEVLLTGGIGWGKTTMAYIGIAYELYLVSCLRNPGAAYGLLPGSNVAFVNISVNELQAKRVFFRGLFNLIENSPYFRDRFPYERNVTNELRFPRGMICYPVATNEQAVLGEGVFSAAFDEVNFMSVVERSKEMPEGGTYDQAVILYNRLSRRIRSRMNQRGRLPGHIWLLSSARYPNDFTERKEAEAKTSKHIFVRGYAAWMTHPSNFYLPQTFKVEVGDTTRQSRVLNGDESDVNAERVIEVPMDFKDEFEKDPNGAVRDYAGISVLSIRPFIARRDLVAQMFQLGDEAGLKHPFSKLDVTLQDESGFLIPENLHWVEAGPTTAPKRPRKTRGLFPGWYYAHVDLAKKTDACGVAIGHVVGTKQLKRGFGPKAGTEMKPIIRIDLVLRVVAPPKGEILASNVRALFYQLHEQGMEFGKITYDSFGSMESIQTLRGEGFNADTFSVDADTLAYEQLKSAIYDERILCYRVPKLEEELVSLMVDEKKMKIDHPPRGSKDLADALAGVICHCEAAQGEIYSPSTLFSLGETSRSGVSEELSREELWVKVYRQEPITEEEIDRLS